MQVPWQHAQPLHTFMASVQVTYVIAMHSDIQLKLSSGDAQYLAVLSCQACAMHVHVHSPPSSIVQYLGHLP